MLLKMQWRDSNTKRMITERMNGQKTKTGPNESRCEIFKTRAIDRTGVRYGRLTAIEPTTKRQNGSIVWRCRCDCGNEILASSKNLVTGRVRSCGCLRQESFTRLATIVGGSVTENLWHWSLWKSAREAVSSGVAAVTAETR